MTLIVVDTSSLDAIAAMRLESFERDGIGQLIPGRDSAIGGLVSLADAMNFAREGEDSWAIEGPAAPLPGGEPAPTRIFAYDGTRLRRGRSMQDIGDFKGRIVKVHLGTFEEMRAAEEASRH